MVPWSTTVSHRTDDLVFSAKLIQPIGADGGNSQSLNTDVEAVVGTTNTLIRMLESLGDHWSIWGVYNRLLTQEVVGQNYVSYHSVQGEIEVFTNANSDANYTGNSVGGRLEHLWWCFDNVWA